MWNNHTWSGPLEPSWMTAKYGNSSAEPVSYREARENLTLSRWQWCHLPAPLSFSWPDYSRLMCLDHPSVHLYLKPYQEPDWLDDRASLWILTKLSQPPSLPLSFIENWSYSHGGPVFPFTALHLKDQFRSPRKHCSACRLSLELTYQKPQSSRLSSPASSPGLLGGRGSSGDLVSVPANSAYMSYPLFWIVWRSWALP